MNRQSLIDASLQEVSDALGISFTRKLMPKNHEYDFSLRLEDIPSPHGFSIKIIEDYLVWRIELSMDDFSGPLLTLMRNRLGERRSGIESFLELAKAKNDQVSFAINGIDAIELSNQDWTEVNLRVRKSYFSNDTEYPSLTSSLLDFMCIILYLLVEDVEWSEPNSQLGKEEGSRDVELVNKYERSRYNRALCIKYYGFKCRGCGELLEEKYGPIGAGVIHVHHIVPVSQMGNAYRLNPIKDLIPLCPNCHNIVHQKNPPLSVEQLREITGFKE